MGIIVKGTSSGSGGKGNMTAMVYYYDSQGTTGPETDPLNCEAIPNPPKDFKLPYVPKWYDWFDALIEKFKAAGIKITDGNLHYNKVMG
jgi:hypothetical protein